MYLLHSAFPSRCPAVHQKWPPPPTPSPHPPPSFQDDDEVNAETYIKKASFDVAECPDKALLLQYKVRGEGKQVR